MGSPRGPKMGDPSTAASAGHAALKLHTGAVNGGIAVTSHSGAPSAGDQRAWTATYSPFKGCAMKNARSSSTSGGRRERAQRKKDRSAEILVLTVEEAMPKRARSSAMWRATSSSSTSESAGTWTARENLSRWPR